MAELRNCTNCGGRVTVSADGRVVACAYCGSSSSVSVDPAALAASLAGDSATAQAGFDRLLDVFRKTLPDRTTIHESGLLFKKTASFDVVLDEFTFRLARSGSRVEAHRMTTVRGITIKTEPMHLEEWLTALAEKLSAMSAASAAARLAFARIAAG